MIINRKGAINALKWAHNGKIYWFTYYNESTGERALQHLDEIECSDGRKGMFPRAKINERFEGAEILEKYEPI